MKVLELKDLCELIIVDTKNVGLQLVLQWNNIDRSIWL